LEPFCSYRRIQFALGWAVGRPNQLLPEMLARLAGAVLAERYGVELDRDADAARRLLGEHAWAVLYPDRDSRAGSADIEGFVNRLEQL
jgi:hypothetical protein